MKIGNDEVPPDKETPSLKGLDCYPPIDIVQIDKYRSCHKGVDQDYDRVRIIIDLHLPEHRKIYSKLMNMVDA